MQNIRRLALVTSLACPVLAPVPRAHAAMRLGFGDKCLDVEAGNTADGTRVNIFHCHGGFDPQWNIERGELVSIGLTLLLDSGVVCSSMVREAHLLM